MQIRQLSFQLGAHLLLNHIEFQLDKPCICTLIGPNGAGKSTLLNILSAYVKPTHGQVFFAGQDIHSLHPKQLAKSRVYLEQAFVLPSWMNTLEYLNIQNKVVDSHLLEQIIVDLELEPLLDKDLGKLSGGQAQRVAIARSLCQLLSLDDLSASVLLLDEPCAQLDIYHAQLVLNTLKKWQAQKQFTLILSLHDIHLSFKYSDVSLLLKQGNLLAFGPNKDVFTPTMLQRLYGTPFSFSYNAQGDCVGVHTH